jgi:hypothetical protein
MADTIMIQKVFGDCDFKSDEFWVKRNGKRDLCSILTVCGDITLFTEHELKTLRDYGKRLTEHSLTLVNCILDGNYIFVYKDEHGYLYRRHSFNHPSRFDTFEKLTGIFDGILHVGESEP